MITQNRVLELRTESGISDREDILKAIKSFLGAGR